MQKLISFASDNNSGIHPQVLQAIQNANTGNVSAYGSDNYTTQAIQKFKEYFGNTIEVFFVFNGTAANVLAMQALTQPFNSIICADTAHLNVDECGAPEKFTGCKLMLIPTTNGKITVAQIQQHLHSRGDQHRVQPKVISIAQTTEYGTVYTPDEIKAIADFAHQHDLFLHMDGARLANAADSLGVNLTAITRDVGVDVLSFGGTKNGILGGEAVIFFRQDLAKNFPFIRKQGMQLASKMRFIAAQFDALLTNDLWLQSAQHANAMARKLADKLADMQQIKITQAVQANVIFATIPKPYIAELQKRFYFYVWNEKTSEVRWMTSFDTSAHDIDEFSDAIIKVCNT